MRYKWLLAIACVVTMVAIAVQSYLYPPQYHFHNSFLVWLMAILGVLLLSNWRREIPPRLLAWLPPTMIALALVSYPNTSMDYLRYLFDGEMIRLWHLSPYTTLPTSLPLDQYSMRFADAFWIHIPSPYGPAWEALMAAVNWLSFNRLVLGIMLLKLISLAGLAVCAHYVYLITGSSRARFLFLTNPVILLNSVATPHIDILIAAAVLVAYYYKDSAIKGGSIALASLLKIHGLIFLPFLARPSVKLWRITLIAGSLVVVLTLCLAPLLHFTLRSMLNAAQYGGVYGRVSLLAYSVLPHASLTTLSVVSYSLFAVCFSALLIAYWRGLPQLHALTLSTFLVPLCLTGLLLPWHFIIPLAFLLANGHRFARWAAMFLTLLTMRSAVRVSELLILAALVVICGLVLTYVQSHLSRRSRHLDQALAFLD